MRFGICTSITNAPVVAKIGFDYIEPGVAGELLPLEDDIPIAALRETLDTSGISAEAFNCLVPGSLRITGPNRDLSALNAYITRTAERAAYLGAKTLIFGSGGARQVPEGYPFDRAWAEIVEFLKQSADIVTAKDIIIAIEPLQHAECNIVNTVEEGTRLAQEVGRPDAVKVLSDLFHVTCNNESYEGTTSAGSILHHVHVAISADRHVPRTEDYDELVSYFDAIKRAGYDNRISLEGNYRDFERDAAEALSVMQKAWA